jgi:hypothetical protein
VFASTYIRLVRGTNSNLSVGYHYHYPDFLSTVDEGIILTFFTFFGRCRHGGRPRRLVHFLQTSFVRDHTDTNSKYGSSGAFLRVGL